MRCSSQSTCPKWRAASSSVKLRCLRQQAPFSAVAIPTVGAIAANTWIATATLGPRWERVVSLIRDAVTGLGGDRALAVSISNIANPHSDDAFRELQFDLCERLVRIPWLSRPYEPRLDPRWRPLETGKRRRGDRPRLKGSLISSTLQGVGCSYLGESALSPALRLRVEQSLPRRTGMSLNIGFAHAFGLNFCRGLDVVLPVSPGHGEIVSSRDPIRRRTSARVELLSTALAQGVLDFLSLTGGQEVGAKAPAPCLLN